VRWLVALLALLALLLGCGESPAPEAIATATAEPEVAGCGTYCRQAGGYGGGDDGKPAEAFLTIGAGPVTVTDGAIPIEITCKWTEPCKGAIMIWADLTELGRADLLVEAGETATILVPANVTEAVDAEVSADFGDPHCPPDSLLPCVAVATRLITP
jgi:hypothetical protein